MIAHIAWRNVWRNKLRSLVVISAIALGLWGGIFSYAFMQGMGEQQVYSGIHTETGHIQLNEPKFLQNYDLQRHIEQSERVEEQIRQLPGVKGVCDRIELTAMTSTAYASRGIMLNGIDPQIYNGVSDLHEYLTEGNFFEVDNGGVNPIVIGQALAEKLHTDLSSRLVVTLQDYRGEISYASFKLVGIYRLHNTEFNEQMAFVRKQDLQKILRLPKGYVSTVSVLLDDTKQTKVIQGQIAKLFPNLQVQSWDELSPMLRMMSGTMTQMSLIFVFIILLALAFGIINTMLMAVMDRTREIGMLLSVGMNQKKIFTMIVLETLFLSLTGALAGLLMSIATVNYLGTSGVNLTAIAEGINALGYSERVYPQLDPGFAPQFAVMVIMIALLSSLFPAMRAIHLKPAEAVRGE
ncbi:MAG: FtsX-like permease family protein [Bacteroidetes bacterium]|nr:FtsX-like permease family protein [Bacteroidota bacterium]